MYMLYILIGLSVEEGVRGVDVDYLIVDECSIFFLGVFFGSVTEKFIIDGFLDFGSVFIIVDYI